MTAFLCPITAPMCYKYMFYIIIMVRTERLELSHLSAPEPKSGASTNFATSAGKAALYCNMPVWQDAV